MKAEMQFAPGPWVRNAYGELVDANGEKVVVADSGLAFGSGYEHPERLGNTALIHAAPDMYVALKDAREYVMELLFMRNLQSAGYTMHGQIPIIEECLENIDAALTKAEGKA